MGKTHSLLLLSHILLYQSMRDAIFEGRGQPPSPKELGEMSALDFMVLLSNHKVLFKPQRGPDPYIQAITGAKQIEIIVTIKDETEGLKFTKSISLSDETFLKQMAWREEHPQSYLCNTEADALLGDVLEVFSQKLIKGGGKK